MPRVHALLAAAALLFGHSAEHRPLTATRVGEGPVKVLVVGSIHGNETAGHAVVGACGARARPPAWSCGWSTPSTPTASGTRRATTRAGSTSTATSPAAGAAAGRPFDTYFPGRRAFSEPESQAVRRLVRRIRPAITVWYHQHLRLVNLSAGADAALVRALRPRASGCPRACCRTTAAPPRAGRTTRSPARARSWSSCRPAGCPRARPGATPPRCSAAARAGPRAPPRRPRPRIVWRKIPFGATRRAQMRAYARRHYGLDTAALRDPKVIVEHFTASGTFSSAFNTFAANAPDVELHERPGVCAHFVVDRDGTIYQLVSLRLMCRHTVGLNDVAIGIEHVGFSRRRDPRPPGADPGLAAAHALAAGPLRDPPARRHRPRREPLEPLPPRARRAPAHPDARRLRAPRDAPLPWSAVSELVLVRHGETEWSRACATPGAPTSR